MSSEKGYSARVPYAELFRPKTINQLVLEPKNKEILEHSLKNVETMPHLVFYGLPGMGKTSAARVVAKQILKECNVFNYLELNACSERGIDVIRSIEKFAGNNSFLNVTSKGLPYKIIFLDEADGLTNDAQNMLKNIMQTHSENSRFILSCNRISKINPAILSRSRVLKFGPVPLQEMMVRIKEVARTQNLNIKDQILQEYCKAAQGDFRRVYNNLDMKQDMPPVDQLTPLVNFLLSRSLQVDIEKVHQILCLKLKVIEEDPAMFHSIVMQNLCKVKTPHIYKIIDKLTRCEFAILSGASVVPQVMGWYVCYRESMENQIERAQKKPEK